MNHEDIIRMAREAGFEDSYDLGYYYEPLKRFAALVAAAAVEQERKEFAVHAVDIARRAVEAEREACAKVCEARYMGDNNRDDMEAKRCAEAIRARGESTRRGNA